MSASIRLTAELRVAAPLHLEDEAVWLAVVARLPWIRRQQQAFSGQVGQGRRDRLDVIEHDGPPVVCLPNNTAMQVRVRPGTDSDKSEAVLQQWY
ncbi:SprT family zinc-dependent metalloprotease [Nitrococcus mobilis]|uniref:Uncharacterized protein n=1 Tax=Nitrococcus mobilis Nb-231 TaxID=314278 RepID=A4BMD0_9GAMM|nr:hypothetical protein [Nitrococcus mobilis]EAR23468.1 hypothetical protein NB231_16648 [Nitrococcus mobilis Nb-231]